MPSHPAVAYLLLVRRCYPLSMTRALLILLLTFASAYGGDETVNASMSISGRFAKGYSFHFTVAADGASLLTVDRPGMSERKTYQIPPDKLSELRTLLLHERFFELGSSYGDIVPDGSITTMTVHLGTKAKTIKLRFLRNGDPNLPEIRRAVRVRLFLRSLVEHPDAVDLSRYDKIILKNSAK